MNTREIKLEKVFFKNNHSTKMGKRLIIIPIIGLLLAFPNFQKYQEKAIAVNVEVPVRVFEGNDFVENLTKDDFVVYEEGIPQEIVGLYSIKGTRILHKEVEKPLKEKIKQPVPNISRRIVLVFQIYEFLPKCEDAVDFLFEEVLQPEDKLIVITPTNAYNLKGKALNRLPREVTARQLKEKIRKDIWRVNVKLRNLISDYKAVAETEWNTFVTERDILHKIKNLKIVSEEKLLKFAENLRNLDGQKYLFFFLQEEDVLMKKYGGGSFFLKMELVKDISFDINKIRRIFSDYSIHFNFLLLTKVKFTDQKLDVTQLSRQDYEKFEITGEYFDLFYEMAKATGGIALSSGNASASLKRAVEVSERYYLIYYQPKDYQADGKFKSIKVKVKNKDYKIIHRTGYIAD